MCVSLDQSLFLPLNWRCCDKGIASLSWQDDPLHAQMILPEATYRACFPDVELPWPVLGELLLPSNTEEVLTAVRVTEEGNTLLLQAEVSNRGAANVSLDWVRMALPMDQCFREDDVFKYEQNVLRHAGLIGGCASLYWQKPGGRPPVTLMVAQGATEVNRFFVDRRYERGSMQANFEGLYALELEDAPLLLSPGQQKAYRFRIAAIEDIHDLNDALYALGGLGVDVLPGMTVFRGQELRVCLNTTRAIQQVYFADECAPVTRLAEGLYAGTAAGTGEKKLMISYADGAFSRLKFFVTDPIGDIMRDHAAHIANYQFETNPADPCYHAILPWNMTDRCRVNSSHNPFDNWMAGGSDEIGLVSGLFLSEKNCYAPEEKEIRVLALYADDFIEQRLTEQPGDRVHRMVPWFEMFEPWAGHGADDVWRAYNYVHVFNIMYNMYRIASRGVYPFLKEARYYLRRAGEYAYAMFQYWMFPDGEGATKYGNMGEMNLPLCIMPALKAEGMEDLYQALEPLIQAKAHYFSTKEYPFGSEMAFDTTAYEAVYAYAKSIGDLRIAKRAANASLANRARTPVWHKYGVDVRGGGDSNWNVSYMTQLGVFPLSDMLMEGYLDDAETAMIAYGATLGGFTMYNSGGVWDDAPINRHSSWWVMDERMLQGNQPDALRPQRKMTGEVGLGYFGALYCMNAYVVDHPRLGQIGLGCRYTVCDGKVQIQPDEWFGRRLCDLVHGFALICENAEMLSVQVCGGQVRVQMKEVSTGGKAKTAIRTRESGKWTWQESKEGFAVFSLES